MSNGKEMVSITRETAKQAAHLLAAHSTGPSLERDTAEELRDALEKPAQQHQGEPVAYIEAADLRDIACGSPWGGTVWGRQSREPYPPRVPVYTHVDPSEVERLRTENEAFDAGMRNLACQLSAGGYNAESLTADQLLEKVQWGLTHLTEAQARLVAQLQADLTERDEQIDVLRQGMTADYDLDAWLAFVEEAPQLRLDAGRYRWLRSRDLEVISQGGVFAGLTPDNLVLNEETLDQAIDAAMAKVVKAPEPCSDCGTPGWTGACHKCVPY